MLNVSSKLISAGLIAAIMAVFEFPPILRQKNTYMCLKTGQVTLKQHYKRKGNISGDVPRFSFRSQVRTESL